VRNNQFVHKDDVLLVIDQDRYSIALANAEAAVAATTLSIMLRDQYQRRRSFPGSPSLSRTSTTRAAVGNSGRQLPAGIASRDTAALNLKRTEGALGRLGSSPTSILPRHVASQGSR
jgi:multidrug efflux pump subunit AcrA (membrane-fusion protein)